MMARPFVAAWKFLTLFSARFQVAGFESLTWITTLVLPSSAPAAAVLGSARAPIITAPPSKAPIHLFICFIVVSFKIVLNRKYQHAQWGRRAGPGGAGGGGRGGRRPPGARGGRD